MKKLQVPLTIVALILLVLGMNTVADKRQEQAKARAKKVEDARRAAELAASTAKAKTDKKPAGHGSTPAFKLPPNSGPAGAPVKLEVFVNDANSCQESCTNLKSLQTDYGDLLRMEWCSMNEPKNAERSDKLAIGCEAGLVINGKIEVEMSKNGGKVLLAFRGPVGDKYKLSDIYRAINMQLAAKGKKPPATTIKKSEL